MSLLILVPLFLIGLAVIVTRVIKWVGEGVEAAIGIGVAACAIFALLVLAKYGLRHAPKSTASTKTPTPATITVRSEVVPTTTVTDRSYSPPATTRAASTPIPIPSPRETMPDAVPSTTIANPTSKPGFGSLWLNVCGSIRKGYYMCKGSKPTAEQIEACFPAVVCAPTESSRSREIPA